MLFLIAIYLVPLAMVLIEAFTHPVVGLQNFDAALSRTNLTTLARTLQISLLATVIAAVLGYPVAYVIVRAPRRLQALLVLGVIVPWLTSMLVRTFGWQILLGRIGPVPSFLRWLGIDAQSMLQTWTGLILGFAQIIIPLFVLPVVAVMRQIDPMGVQAARSQGAGPAEAFWRVFVPQSRPGIEVGLMLAFVSSLGSFVIPAILGGQDATMTGVVINELLNGQGRRGAAAALAIFLSITLFLVLILSRLATQRSRRWLAARAGKLPVRSARERPARRKLRPMVQLMRYLDRVGLSKQRWIVGLYVTAVMLLLLLPQLIVIPISFSDTRTMVFPPSGLSLQWYSEFFSPKWLGAVGSSLVVAPIAAVVAMFLGALAAVGVERSAGRRWQGAAMPLLVAPIIVPIVVIAVGFYLLLDTLGLLDTLPGVILVQITLVIPFAFVVVRASVQSLDPVYEQAARSLGAGRVRVLRKIILPLILPAVIVGLLLSFLHLFDEATVPIFVTAFEVTLLPKQMYDSIVVTTDPTVAVVSALSMLVAGLILAVSLAVSRRSKTATLDALTLGDSKDGAADD